MNLSNTLRVFVLGAIAALPAATSLAAITARGSDSTIKVMQALAGAYAKKSGVEVQVVGGGSSAGAKAAIDGQADLAFLSRAVDAKEESAGLVGVPYAADAVAVIVNKANPVSDLSIDEAKSFFTGSTTAWPDGRPVVVFNRNADSGTREIVQEKVLGKGVAFSPTAAIKHDGVLLGSVAKIPTSLAYDGFGDVDASLVKIVSIDGVTPTPETIADSSYPLTRTPTLATKGGAKGEAAGFIEFVLSDEGQSIVKASGLLPLTSTH